MRLFLDTSSLIKLYHEEKDSEFFKNIIVQNAISSIFLSELTRVEFLSALWKKSRQGELSTDIVAQIAGWFNDDAAQFTFIPLDEHTIDQADLFMTSDKLLRAFLVKEQLPTERG